MAVDYGFFEALTGPMKAAGQIQAQRDQQKMQQFRHPLLLHQGLLGILQVGIHLHGQIAHKCQEHGKS